MQQHVIVVVFDLWSRMIPDDFLKNCSLISRFPFSVGSDNCSCYRKELLTIPYEIFLYHFSRQYCFELKSSFLDMVLICLTLCLWNFSKYTLHSAKLLMKVLNSIRFGTRSCETQLSFLLFWYITAPKFKFAVSHAYGAYFF